VRQGLQVDATADSDRFIHDSQILAWINEAIVDLADRTRSVRGKVSLTTDGTEFIVLPSDFTAFDALYVDDMPTQFVDDDEEWNDWAFSDSLPERTLVRISEPNIELYPKPGAGTAYALYYVARPYEFTSTTDTNLTTLPKSLQIRTVHYARAQAHWLLRNFFEGDRFMSLYQQGLQGGEFDQPTDEDKAKAREVQDYEIVSWVNEGLLQIAFREDVIPRQAAAGVSAGMIDLPADYLKLRQLQLSVAGNDGTYGVQMVDDHVFVSWSTDSAGAVPRHTLGRFALPQIELYPVPATGTTATIRYFARPKLLTKLSDQPEVPFTLQRKAVSFAINQALMSAPMDQTDLARADRYAAQFEQGLRPGTANQRTFPGPIEITPEGNVFDYDPLARHL
jgi:hypothetical protein